VHLFEDGTKIRKTEDKEFIPEFAENIDIKITNKCTGTNCAWCHEGSSKTGKHGSIMSERFIDTLKPWQEIAIGGGNVLEHPSLVPFLRKLKYQDVIANITVNQIHFERDYGLIEQLINENLIYGLGVSLVNPTDLFIEKIKNYSNTVIHVINGVLTKEQCMKICDHEIKMLILGYKDLRRGCEYYEKQGLLVRENQMWLYQNLSNLLDHFKVISFDNLSIEQLDVKRLFSEDEWAEFYMGDDGMFTFYIDMVERTFAKSSTTPFENRYTLLNDVVEMFKRC